MDYAMGYYNMETPLEELDEVLATLKAIQKHQREVHLLVQRTQTMCPHLMNTTYHNPLANFMSYGIDIKFYEYDEGATKLLEQLMERKKFIEEQAKEQEV